MYSLYFNLKYTIFSQELSFQSLILMILEYQFQIIFHRGTNRKV